MGEHTALAQFVQDNTGLKVQKARLHGPRSSLQSHNLPFQQDVLAQAQHSTPGPALSMVKVSSNLSACTHLDISSHSPQTHFCRVCQILSGNSFDSHSQNATV